MRRRVSFTAFIWPISTISKTMCRCCLKEYPQSRLKIRLEFQIYGLRRYCKEIITTPDIGDCRTIKHKKKCPISPCICALHLLIYIALTCVFCDKKLSNFGYGKCFFSSTHSSRR
ncbi:hypothetical protein TNCV_3639491 [Trichonephila clavipes]|nr:hypothetical protein TNCV_3639491 [Trichonephila clavipes]